MDKATNVLKNAVAPLDWRKEGQLVGTAAYVAIEVAVSYIVRNVLKMEKKSLLELASIHGLSVPFMGGAGAPFGPITGIAATTGYGTAFKDGAKGIPAVLLAQWVIATAYKGFHFPWFTLKDLLITAGSKTVTRPLVYSISGMLKNIGVADGIRVIDELINSQVANSNLNFSK